MSAKDSKDTNEAQPAAEGQKANWAILKSLKDHAHLAVWIAAIAALLSLAIYGYMSFRPGPIPSVVESLVEPPEPALEGVATFHYVSFPRSIEERLRESDNFRTIIEQVELPDELSSLSKAEKEKVFELIHSYVSDQLDGIVGLYGLVKYDGYLSIRIRNLTTRTLEDVTLQLPYYFRIAEVYRKGVGTRELTDYANQITFGEMRPEEEISATAWLESFSSSYGEEMKLLHRDGVGPVYETKVVRVEKD